MFYLVGFGFLHSCVRPSVHTIRRRHGDTKAVWFRQTRKRYFSFRVFTLMMLFRVFSKKQHVCSLYKTLSSWAIIFLVGFLCSSRKKSHTHPSYVRPSVPAIRGDTKAIQFTATRLHDKHENVIYLFFFFLYFRSDDVVPNIKKRKKTKRIFVQKLAECNFLRQVSMKRTGNLISLLSVRRFLLLVVGITFEKIYLNYIKLKTY